MAISQYHDVTVQNLGGPFCYKLTCHGPHVTCFLMRSSFQSDTCELYCVYREEPCYANRWITRVTSVTVGVTLAFLSRRRQKGFRHVAFTGVSVVTILVGPHLRVASPASSQIRKVSKAQWARLTTVSFASQTRGL